ncbi:hypothetical protein [Mesorhizobium sp.]|uniref:hypothetical protein n=1 Tax=Mesorhizobium sp. TaxID=1871066 RepID=UPI00344DA3F2
MAKEVSVLQANGLTSPSNGGATLKTGGFAMRSEGKKNSDSVFEGNRGSRNPFGVMDVPTPDDEEVSAFAAGVKLEGTASDENAEAWGTENDRDRNDTIEGSWSSRWNGGADPAIPGDSKDKWKSGRGEVKAAGERVYLLFDWHGGVRKGLIDARRQGAKGLVGKYINLTDRRIVRPWVGLIVSNRRIDGKWPGGRLDFRR